MEAQGLLGEGDREGVGHWPYCVRRTAWGIARVGVCSAESRGEPRPPVEGEAAEHCARARAA